MKPIAEMTLCELAECYYWKDRQALEQAILVFQAPSTNLEEIARWSDEVGMRDEFGRIKSRFHAEEG